MKPRSELRVLIDRIPFAEGNLGEEAILTSLLQDLEVCGVQHITVSSNLPERTRQRHGNRIRVIPDVFWRWLLLPLEVSRVDLVIWGGGHMLQDRSSRWYIPYVTKILLLAKIQGVPRYIYAPGLGPVLTRLGRRLSHWALKGAQVITVRDHTSAAFLDDLGLSGQYLRTADPAYSLALTGIETTPKANHPAPVIGVAPRRLFYRKGSWKPVSWQLAAAEKNPQFDHFLQELAAALDHLIEQRQARVLLLPMDLGPNPRDDLICFRLRNYLVHPNACEIVSHDPALPDFLNILSHLDLLISTRLHGLILGLRFGLPFIGIDSDGKITQFAASIEHPNWVVKDQEADRDTLFRLACQALDDPGSQRKKLLLQGAVMADRAQQNRAELKKCLDRISQEG